MKRFLEFKIYPLDKTLEAENFYLDEEEPFTKLIKNKINKLTSLRGKTVLHNNIKYILQNSKIEFKKTNHIPTKEELISSQVILLKFIELILFSSDLGIGTIYIYCKLYDFDLKILDFSNSLTEIKKVTIEINKKKLEYYKKWGNYKFGKLTENHFTTEESEIINFETIISLNKYLDNKLILKKNDFNENKIKELILIKEYILKEKSFYFDYCKRNTNKFDNSIPNDFELKKELKEFLIETKINEINELKKKLEQKEKEIFLKKIDLTKESKNLNFDLSLLYNEEILNLINKFKENEYNSNNLLNNIKESMKNKYKEMEEIKNDKV